MTRILVIVAAVISVFILPPFVTVVLAAAGSLLFPPTALAIGLLADALYLPQGSLPYASLLGLSGTAVAILMRRFMKTRIIGA